MRAASTAAGSGPNAWASPLCATTAAVQARTRRRPGRHFVPPEDALYQPGNWALWIEQPDLMLQLLTVGDVDIDILRAVAGALVVTPTQ